MDVILWESLVIAILVTFLLFSIRINTSKKNVEIQKGEFPGRIGFPFIGETLSLLTATNGTKGCYDFVRVRRIRYGDWFKTRIFGKIHVFVPSVEGAKTVYKNDFGLFNKRYMKSMADLVGENSVLVVPKHSHVKIRRLLSQPFSINNVAQFVPKLDKMLSEKLKEFEANGRSFSVLRYTMKMGFDIICNTLMSISDATLLDKMERDCIIIYDAMLTLPIMIPGTRYYNAIKARQRIMERFKAIIRDRRSGKVSANDFLQSMLDRDSYPSDEKLDDKEILDNLLTSLLSGRNTTATAMMWCVKFLSDNQHVQDKLRDEQLFIQNEIGDRGSLTYADLSKMSYASKVIKETLRMSNIVVWLPRVASENCTIEDFEIKKGWHVNIDVSHIHYDPKLHKDPMCFDPSRFEELPKPYTYMPFGSGPRVCLGINMAKVTMLIFLHRLTSGYTWTLDDQDPRLECKGFIPKLKSGCPITLKALNRDTSITPKAPDCDLMMSEDRKYKFNMQHVLSFKPYTMY